MLDMIRYIVRKCLVCTVRHIQEFKPLESSKYYSIDRIMAFLIYIEKVALRIRNLISFATYKNMVYGRENAGQLFEITVSYISMKILEAMNSRALEVEDCVCMYLDFLRIVSPSMAEDMEKFIDNLDDDDLITFISSLTFEKSIYLAIEPMSENMTIDKVKALYERFYWIKPENLMMPVKDSTGKIRYAPSRRPLVYGYQYIYRLKQYAEEKFSVTSLSATNIRNENSKSKSSNNYKALYSRTPIRFGVA